jgi:hypothetical protein
MQRCPALLILFLVLPLASRAQIRFLPDEFERVDVIAIERDQRNLYSFDALTGRRSVVRLEAGEDVLFERIRGRIGLVLTNRRALGVAPGVDWRELRYRLQEHAPDIGVVEDQVALVVTDRRALGFSGQGRWVEQRLTSHETAEALRVGSGAGVVVTNRRVLGMAPDLNRFIEIKLQIKEILESVAAQGALVTLRTDRRILVFSAPRGTWSEQKRLLK